jgi:hypothetical protein
MKPIPVTMEPEKMAERLVWFEPAAEALADPIRFLAYAFARATHEDMTILRRFVTEDHLREALDHAPPGIIDPRSWAYWNVMMERYPTPPAPSRGFLLPQRG